MLSLQQELSTTGETSQGKKYVRLFAVTVVLGAIVGTFGFLASERHDANTSGLHQKTAASISISFDLGCIRKHGITVDCAITDHDKTIHHNDLAVASFRPPVTKPNLRSSHANSMDTLAHTATETSQGSEVQRGPALSRRSVLQQASSAALLSASLPATAQEPPAFSNMGGLLEAYTDTQKGYKLYRPSGWTKFETDPGVFDVKFQDVIEPETVVIVSTSAVRNSTSISALGELDAVGEKFAKSRKAELVSAKSRYAGDSLVYTLELKGEKFHELLVLTINRGKLFRLNTVTSEKKWSKRKDLYQNVAASFVPQGY